MITEKLQTAWLPAKVSQCHFCKNRNPVFPCTGFRRCEGLIRSGIISAFWQIFNIIVQNLFMPPLIFYILQGYVILKKHNLCIFKISYII